MMFVKYCPDSTLAAIFRFKAPERWTAQEIQEQLDWYQIEMKERTSAKPKHHAATRHITAHIQTFNEHDSVNAGPPVESGERSRVSNVYTAQSKNNCMNTLINPPGPHAVSEHPECG